ncbi:MAG: hypothetical protein WBE72_01085 [Terracidiphilus sp.]
MNLRQNPIFVAAWTAFSGALVEQLAETLQSGHLSFTLKSWESMLGTALVVALIAVLHLYIPPPNPKS